MAKKNTTSKKTVLRRRSKTMIESSDSSEIQDINSNILRNPIDDNRHYEQIHVQKYSTYKIGNFKNKNLKTFAKNLDVYGLKYMEIASKYSIRPKKKLCDFTGLPAMFTCPYTRLNYFDSSVYKQIKGLSSDVIKFIYETKELGRNYNPFQSSK